MSYMCSYNAINGVPSCANRELLTDLLRESWKFDGFVVSDCGRLREVVGGREEGGRREVVGGGAYIVQFSGRLDD